MKIVKGFLIIAVTFCMTTAGVAQYKLTANFTGFNPHIGQAFYMRVIDNMSGDEVGRKMIPAIPGASFSMELWTLIQGHSYMVDLFADFNNNGKYDPPPSDHAWRLQVNNVADHTTLNFTHNVTFTDIAWPDPSKDATMYAGTWTGYWHNLTFGSQGDITAVTSVDTVSDKIMLHMETSGVFGDPAPVTYDLESPFIPGADSLVFTAPAPWTGDLIIKPGDILTAFTVPSYGIQLNIPGNYGPNQIIMAYFMTGAFEANGVIVLTKSPLATFVNSIEPESLQLLSNYPNPFNPETTIQYTLKEPEHMRLTIFNLQGQWITTLTDEYKQAGSYSVHWNAADQPSGTYIYQLQTGQDIRTRKMILQK